MKKRQLLAILLGMYFFTVAASADSDRPRPQTGTIDIYEAVKVAEEMLLNEGQHYVQEYKDRKLVIDIIEKHYTQCNFILVRSKVCVCNDLQADKFAQLYTEDVRFKDIFEELENRTYWLVYFAPAELVAGGDIAFFIDAETSELIDVFRGR